MLESDIFEKKTSAKSQIIEENHLLGRKLFERYSQRHIHERDTVVFEFIGCGVEYVRRIRRPYMLRIKGNKHRSPYRPFGVWAFKDQKGRQKNQDLEISSFLVEEFKKLFRALGAETETFRSIGGI